MNGPENIINSIKSKAALEAADIQASAKKEVLKVKINADERKAALCASHSQQLKKELDALRAAALASDKQYERQEMLCARSRAISGIIEYTRNKIKSLPDEEYFKLMLALFKRNAKSHSGMLVLSEKDRHRLGKRFYDECSRYVHDGTLTLSDEYLSADGGFVIVYGKIEENCTIDSIFADKYPALSDIASKQLSDISCSAEE